jgi:membrane-associated phospholipid phosphatase
MHHLPGRGVSPLLSQRGRLIAVILLACALVIFAAGLPFVHGGYADPADRVVDSWSIAHLGPHGTALQLLSDLGERNAVAVLTLLLALACLAARRASAVVLALVSAPVAAALTEWVLKGLVGHLYVDATYPSGHATALFALAVALIVLVASPRRRAGWLALRVVVCVVAVLVAVAVAVAVIALGDHHFADAIGGAATGTAVVLAGALVLDLPLARRVLALAGPFSRAPSAAPIEITQAH